MEVKNVYLTQIGLSVLCICLSLSIIGTAADSLRVYKQQRDAQNPWWLPLWPEHFNTSGTSTLIGVASTVTFLHLLYLVGKAVPRVSLLSSDTTTTLITYRRSLLPHHHYVHGCWRCSLRSRARS